jgi:hypothetical protein
MVNNDGAGFTITKKRNHKRLMKLQGGVRKRFKNKLPNLIYYSDSELTFEIEIGSVNRDSETARAKIGTFKIDPVNVITETLTH